MDTHYLFQWPSRKLGGYVGLTGALGSMNYLCIANTCCACIAKAGGRDSATKSPIASFRTYVGRIDLTNTAILGYFDGDEMRGGRPC
jgi:hypothetical protein